VPPEVGAKHSVSAQTAGGQIEVGVLEDVYNNSLAELYIHGLDRQAERLFKAQVGVDL